MQKIFDFVVSFYRDGVLSHSKNVSSVSAPMGIILAVGDDPGILVKYDTVEKLIPYYQTLGIHLSIKEL